jgi:hypothetical protein
MEFKVKPFEFKSQLHEKLFSAGITGAKRDALGKVLASSGLGAYTADSHVLREGELHDLMRVIDKHPELKAHGWTEIDTARARRVLGEHFAPPSHSSHAVAPANDDDIAPVRQIV